MKKVKAAFRGIVIFLLCVIEIYPLFWMLTASFKKQAEWSEKPAYALNDGFYFQNYSDAWTRGHMSTFFKNSLITTLVALVFIVFFSVTVGFAVTKMKWKFRNAVAQYFRFGIMIPVAIALIPLFQIYSRSNLLNTRTCLIITYIAFGLSLSIYLVQGYLRSFSHAYKKNQHRYDRGRSNILPVSFPTNVISSSHSGHHATRWVLDSYRLFSRTSLLRR